MSITAGTLLQLDFIRIGTTDGWAGLIIPATLLILYVTVMWRLFEKGGEKPWLGPIPVVNMFYLARMAGKPMRWGFLTFIPIAGTVFWFLLCLALAKRFGRGKLFGAGLALLPVIFFAELALGPSELVRDPYAEMWARRGLSAPGGD